MSGESEAKDGVEEVLFSNFAVFLSYYVLSFGHNVHSSVGFHISDVH